MSAPAAAPIPRGQAIGAIVASSIGFGWWLFAVGALPTAVALAAGAAGLVIAVLVMRQARLRLRVSPVRAARPFPWLGFGAAVAAEVVGLNLALWLLRAPELRAYWIPAISLVVGLHFLPLARLFHRGELLACAAAMSLGAALTAGSVAVGAPATLAAALEGAANALILWGTAGYSVRPSPRRATPV